MQTGVIAILGLASLFIGWVLTIVLPGIRYISWGILALGAVLVLVAFVVDYRRVGGALASRRGRFSAGTTLMAAIFIGIILLANAISDANYKRIDVTGLSQYTLTSQTKEVLTNLDTPVTALGFFVPGDLVADFLDDLLDEYSNFTDQLTIKIVDPEQRPDLAREYGVGQYPAVVFEAKHGYRRIPPSRVVTQLETGEISIEAEHAFTSAILEVTGTKQRKVYFLSGHGENNLFSTATDGYSTVREGLMDNLYQVEALDIRIAGDIPEDCTVLVIAGSKGPLTEREVKLIGEYLESGGWALILLNPDPPEGLREIVSRWGTDVRDGVIIDEGSYTAPNKDSPVVPPIRNFFAQYGLYEDTYFPGATAVLPQEGFEPNPLMTQTGLLQIVWSSEDSRLLLQSLLRTSSESWLETDLRVDIEPQFNEKEDIQGPLNIGFFILRLPEAGIDPEDEELAEQAAALAWEGTRLAVIGDSDFASNGHFRNGGNGSLFLTCIHYLAQGEELITMDRKFLQTRRLIVSPEAAAFINISSIGLLPLVVLGVGVYVWWRRR